MLYFTEKGYFSDIQLSSGIQTDSDIKNYSDVHAMNYRGDGRLVPLRCWRRH